MAHSLFQVAYEFLSVLMSVGCRRITTNPNRTTISPSFFDFMNFSLTELNLMLGSFACASYVETENVEAHLLCHFAVMEPDTRQRAHRYSHLHALQRANWMMLRISYTTSHNDFIYSAADWVNDGMGNSVLVLAVVIVDVFCIYNRYKYMCSGKVARKCGKRWWLMDAKMFGIHFWGEANVQIDSMVFNHFTADG